MIVRQAVSTAARFRRAGQLATAIDVKKLFYVFFILVTFLRFFDVFLFSKRFYIFKKTLAKFRAASRLTRSTFKIRATKQTYDFSVARRMT